MPKILRIINRFNLGGPTYNAAYLTKYMPGRFETTLVGGIKDKSEDSSQFIIEKLGITPQQIPWMHRDINLWSDYAAYQKLKQIIRKEKPDIVHTHASKSGALGRLAAADMKVPVIVHTFHGHVFHSYFNKPVTKAYKFIERHLARKSSAIVAISNIQKQELTVEHKICPPEKVAVIPLGFQLDRFQEDLEEKRNVFRREFDLNDSDIAIATIGRLVSIKNHRLFLRAISYLKTHTAETIRAFIVGDGEEKAALQAYCSELGLSWSGGNEKCDVVFTSWVRNVDFVTAGADIIAMTSKNEGTPVSIIEAQAANKPIVSTQVGGIEDIVLKNQTALLSAAGNDEQFYENMKKLVQDKALRMEMGRRGWEHVRQKFHVERLIKDMTDLYDQLLP